MNFGAAIWKVHFGRFGLLGLVWLVYLGRFNLVGLAWQVWYGRYGLEGLFGRLGYVQFGRKNNLLKKKYWDQKMFLDNILSKKFLEFFFCRTSMWEKIQPKELLVQGNFSKKIWKKLLGEKDVFVQKIRSKSIGPKYVLAKKKFARKKLY